MYSHKVIQHLVANELCRETVTTMNRDSRNEN